MVEIECNYLQSEWIFREMKEASLDCRLPSFQ